MERKPVKALTEAEIKILLQGIDDDLFQRIVQIDLATGLRRGEILGLSWADIDFDAHTLSINRSVIRENGKDTLSQNLKTKSSRRTMALDNKTIAILHKQKTYCDRLRLQRGKNFDKEKLNLVFPDAGGALIHQNTLSKLTRRYFDKAGLSEFTFHSLRHTHATMLVKAGVHFKIIQHRLGHSTFAVTMDIYSHITPEMDQQAANVIEKIL